MDRGRQPRGRAGGMGRLRRRARHDERHRSGRARRCRGGFRMHDPRRCREFPGASAQPRGDARRPQGEGPQFSVEIPFHPGRAASRPRLHFEPVLRRRSAAAVARKVGLQVHSSPGRNLAERRPADFAAAGKPGSRADGERVRVAARASQRESGAISVAGSAPRADQSEHRSHGSCVVARQLSRPIDANALGRGAASRIL